LEFSFIGLQNILLNGERTEPRGKSKMRTCEVCGCRLITGRKYCWKHRNYHEEPEPKTFNPLGFPLGIVRGIIDGSKIGVVCG